MQAGSASGAVQKKPLYCQAVSKAREGKALWRTLRAQRLRASEEGFSDDPESRVMPAEVPDNVV
eukprot:2405286-Lingulodinium_polyedra.AAC.1